MKVLALIHGLGVGGAEHVTADLARELRARGHEVELGCFDEIGEIGESLRTEGFRVELYGRRSGFDPSLPARIRRHARRFAPTVAHAHQYTAFVYAALATRQASWRLVYTEHGVHGPNRLWRRRLFDRLFEHRATTITAVSGAVRDQMLARWGFRSPIEVVPNGVRVERFQPATPADRRARRRELGLADDLPLLGVVGRLYPVKNVGLVVQAFAALEPEARLLVVGEGPERAALERLAERLGVAGRVRFEGQRLDVDRLLPALDLLVTASRFEGSPLALLEAAAAGVPIVAAGNPGIEECFTNGRDAWIVPWDSPPDGREPIRGDAERAALRRFVGELRSALADPAERARRAAAANRRVCSSHDQLRIFDRYEALLSVRDRANEPEPRRC